MKELSLGFLLKDRLFFRTKVVGQFLKEEETENVVKNLQRYIKSSVPFFFFFFLQFFFENF